MHDINIEFPGDDRAIFRVGVFHSLAFHCKTKHPLIFSQNVEESCTFQKIYGLRKVKLKILIARQARENTKLVENVKEINYRFHTLREKTSN